MPAISYPCFQVVLFQYGNEPNEITSATENENSICLKCVILAVFNAPFTPTGNDSGLKGDSNADLCDAGAVLWSLFWLTQIVREREQTRVRVLFVRALVLCFRPGLRVHTICYFRLKPNSFAFFTQVFLRCFQAKNTHYDRKNAIYG